MVLLTTRQRQFSNVLSKAIPMYHILHKYLIERSGIDEHAFQFISEHFTFKKVRRNEFLLRYGDVCRHFYFVEKGCVRLFSITNEGQEITRYFAFEGSFGTALTSFIQETPAFEFVQAVEKSEVLMIGRKDFYKLVDTVPAMSLVYRKILEGAYITSQQRIYGFQGLNALDKLRWLLNHQPDILVRLSNKLVASYLGVTPFTLSRLKSEV